MSTMFNAPEGDPPPITIGVGEQDYVDPRYGMVRHVRTVLPVSDEALAYVRASFNPARSLDVGTVKVLAAMLIHAALVARDRPELDEDGPGGGVNVPNRERNKALARARREASIAITEIETGCMWLVKALTA